MVLWYCSVVLLVDSEEYNTTGFLIIKVLTQQMVFISKICDTLYSTITQESFSKIATGRLFSNAIYGFFMTHRLQIHMHPG